MDWLFVKNKNQIELNWKPNGFLLILIAVQRWTPFTNTTQAQPISNHHSCQMVKEETKKLRHRESKRPISMANTIENLSIDYEKLIIRIENSLKLQFQ